MWKTGLELKETLSSTIPLDGCLKTQSKYAEIIEMCEFVQRVHYFKFFSSIATFSCRVIYAGFCNNCFVTVKTIKGIVMIIMRYERISARKKIVVMMKSTTMIGMMMVMMIVL